MKALVVVVVVSFTDAKQLNSEIKVLKLSSVFLCMIKKLIQFEKVHPLDPQDVYENETQASRNDKENQIQSKGMKDWDHIPRSQLQLQSMQPYRTKSIKRLQDMLKESQSDSSTPVDSCYIDFEYENYLEVYTFRVFYVSRRKTK